MFEVTKIDDIAILHLFGEITQLEMEHIEKIIISFKKHHHRKIVLDLAHVDHVHFQAVKNWIETAKLLRGESGDLKIVNAGEQTRQVFKFTGADQHLSDYASMGDAILSFLKKPDYGWVPSEETKEVLSLDKELEKTKGSFLIH